MKRGFTLIELLIVLTILGVLTLVAVGSLQPLAEQARYETTRTTLQRIEEAVMGPENMRQIDGTPIISGFVADIGRLPLPGPDPPPGWELQELWNPDLWTMFPYRTRLGPLAFDGEDFSHVRIACGWRGAYVQPPTADGLRDGWGKPLVYHWPGDSSVPPSQPANSHSALAIAADLTVEMPSLAESPRLMSLVSLIGSVIYADGTLAVSNGDQNITVKVYLIYPSVDQPETLAVVGFQQTSTEPDFVFTSVPPGLRAIRAVVRRNETEVIADKTVYRHVLRTGLSDVRIELGTSPPAAPVEGDED